MKSSTIIIATIVIVLIVAGFIVLKSQGFMGNSVRNNNYGNMPSLNPNSQNPVKLSDTPFANKAYLISADTLSADAQNALSGFNLEKTTMPDGTLNITLKAYSSEYQDQNYIVKPGQQLYFIETSMGDDSAPQGEYNLRDDHAVLLDSKGYIINNGQA